MTLAELMENRTMQENYAGQITADDMVLAVNLDDASEVEEYIVAQPYIAEHSGSLDAQSQDSQYIRAGKQTTKTGATRTITVSGDRYAGDPFQDSILDHKIKYGTGSAVVKDYVYFAIQNGKGEIGQVTIVVESDASGAAGENLSFSAALTSTKTPVQYKYTNTGA